MARKKMQIGTSAFAQGKINCGKISAQDWRKSERVSARG